MLSSGSCDGADLGIEALAAGRAEALVRRLPYDPARPPDEQTLRRLARDFASVFYSMLVKQMQRTVGGDEEDADAISEGVRDFMGMFLPQVAARHPRDALAEYIFQQVNARYGGRLDESA